MADKIGIVVNNDPDGWARVVTDRSGGCGGCHSNHGAGASGCRTCLTSSKLESLASNRLGANTGDLVRLSIPSSSVLQGVALLYLLPIAGLLLGAIGGSYAAHALGWSETAGAVPGALIVLAAAVWAVVRIGRRPKVIRRMTPDITAILERAEKINSPSQWLPHSRG